MPKADPSNRPVNRGWYKRPFDVGLLLLAHILLLPLWLVLWTFIPIAIWLEDRGPIFYKQQRAGKDGRIFTIRKFRTMVPNADLIGPAWTIQGDLRLTRVGKVLRRTALDELPELGSIFKGDMSLVGPRALAVGEQETLQQEITGFVDRLSVRPGLTGLAQIYDREDNANDKIKYDLQYLQRMGPWLDTTLLTLSVWNTIARRWDKRGGKVSGDRGCLTNVDHDAAPERQDGPRV